MISQKGKEEGKEREDRQVGEGGGEKKEKGPRRKANYYIIE